MTGLRALNASETSQLAEERRGAFWLKAIRIKNERKHLPKIWKGQRESAPFFLVGAEVTFRGTQAVRNVTDRERSPHFGKRGIGLYQNVRDISISPACASFLHPHFRSLVRKRENPVTISQSWKKNFSKSVGGSVTAGVFIKINNCDQIMK